MSTHLLEQVSADSFGLIKFFGFSMCFLAVAGLQILVPHDAKGILINWKKNVPLAAINSGAMMILCASCVCTWAQYLERNNLGLFNRSNLEGWLETCATLLLLDATAYGWHRLNHRFSALWRFHAVHHSDRVFEASTALRFHLGELLPSLLVRLAVVGIFGLSVLSILTFELIYQFFNIFVHGNLRLPTWFERVWTVLFVSPAIHRRHHSEDQKDMNSNFGTIFSLWDKLGTSWHQSTSQDRIRTGLGRQDPDRNFLELLKQPL